MKVNKILAVRTDRFGEFLLNIPALRALKETFAGSQLTLVANPKVLELAEALEGVDEVISWEDRKHKFSELSAFASELKRRKFDLCVIFNPSREFNIISFLAGIPNRLGYNRKWGFLLTHKLEDKKHLGQKHEIDYNLDLVSVIGAGTLDKKLYLKVEELNAGALGLVNFDNLAVLHPWTSDPVKQWPVGNFRKLAQKLDKELNIRVVVVGAKEEQDKSIQYFDNLSSNVINLTGKTTLMQLALLLKKSQLLISGDSGPVHLASCVGTPVVAIFRNDIQGKNPERWGPVSPGSTVVENKSLSEISVEEVFKNAERILKQ
jgi:ADP-heptose:LPS heptosyltransferase